MEEESTRVPGKSKHSMRRENKVNIKQGISYYNISKYM